VQQFLARESHAAARLGRLDRETQTVQLRDGRDETQAQAASGRMTALFPAIKAPQHRLALRLRNSGPGITDFDPEAALRAEGAHLDVPPGGRELDRVVPRVADRLAP